MTVTIWPNTLAQTKRSQQLLVWSTASIYKKKKDITNSLIWPLGLTILASVGHYKMVLLCGCTWTSFNFLTTGIWALTCFIRAPCVGNPATQPPRPPTPEIVSIKICFFNQSQSQSEVTCPGSDSHVPNADSPSVRSHTPPTCAVRGRHLGVDQRNWDYITIKTA